MTPEERMLDYEVNPPQLAQLRSTICKFLAIVIFIGALVAGSLYHEFVLALGLAGIAFCTLE